MPLIKVWIETEDGGSQSYVNIPKTTGDLAKDMEEQFFEGRFRVRYLGRKEVTGIFGTESLPAVFVEEAK